MNSRYARLPLLLVVVLSIGGTLAYAQKRRPKDQVGNWLLLAVTGDKSQEDRSVRRTVAVILKRCNGLGIRCKLQRQSGENANRLKLHFATRIDSTRVKRILLAEGLEMRPVVSPSFPEPLLEYPTREAALAAAVPETDAFPFVNEGVEKRLVVERTLILTADDLRNCGAFPSEDEGFGKYEVGCMLKSPGSARLKAWTGANINRYVALVFNRQVYSAAYVKAVIEYDFSVSGGFDRRQAQDLIIVFHSGNLPAPVELLDEGTSRL